MSSPIRPGQVHRLSSPHPLSHTQNTNEVKSSPLRPSFLSSTSFQPPRSSPLASSSSSSSSSSRPPLHARSYSAPPRPPPPRPPPAEEPIVDVAIERYSSSRRLLDEWEQIALKYKDVKLEDDDEIDIRTGKIVKDRGKLRAMENVRFFGDDRSEDEEEEEVEDEDDDGLGGWDLRQFESFFQGQEEPVAEEEEEEQEPQPPKEYLYFPPPAPPVAVRKHVVDEGDLKEFLEESRMRKELGLDGDVEEGSETGSTESGSGGGWESEEESYDEDEEEDQEAGSLEESDDANEEEDDNERATLQHQLTTLDVFDLSDDDPLASSPVPQEKLRRSASLPAPPSTFQRPTPPPTISYPLASSSSSKPKSNLSRSSPLNKSPLKNVFSPTASPPRVPPPPIDISDSSDDDEEDEDDEEDDAFVPPEEKELALPPPEIYSVSDSEDEPLEDDDDEEGDDLNIQPSPFRPKREESVLAQSIPPSPPASASPPPSTAVTTVDEDQDDNSPLPPRRRSSRTPVPRDFFSSAGYLPAPLHLSSLPPSSSTQPQQRPPLPKPFAHIPLFRPSPLASEGRFASALPTPPLSVASGSSSSSSSILSTTTTTTTNLASTSSSSSLTRTSSITIRQVRFASPEEEDDMSPLRPTRKPMHRVRSREQLKPLLSRVWADELKGRELLRFDEDQREERKRKRVEEEETVEGERGGKSKKGKGKEREVVGAFGFFDRPTGWEEGGDEVVDEEEEEEEEDPTATEGVELEETQEEEEEEETENVWENGEEVLMVAPWRGPLPVEKRLREEEEEKAGSKFIAKRRKILDEPEDDPFIDPSAPPPPAPPPPPPPNNERRLRRSSLPNFRPITYHPSSSSSSSNFRIASPAPARPPVVVASSPALRPKLERSSPVPASSPLFINSNSSRIPRPISSLRPMEDMKPTLPSSSRPSSSRNELEGFGALKSKTEKTFLDTPTLMSSIERTVALLQLRRGTENWGEEVVKEANEEWVGSSTRRGGKGNAIASSSKPSFLETDPLSLLDDADSDSLPPCSNCVLRDRPAHLANVCLGRLLLPIDPQSSSTASSTAPRRMFCSFLDADERRPWEKTAARLRLKEEEVEEEIGGGSGGGSNDEKPWTLDRFIDSLPDVDAPPPSRSTPRPTFKKSSSARPRYTL